MFNLLHRLSILAVLLPALSAPIVAQDEDGPAKLEITTEDPAKLADGAYAKFTVKAALNKGDKIDWEVSPKPLRADRMGNVLIVDGTKGVTYTLKVHVIGPAKNGIRWEKGVVEYTFGGKVIPPPDKEPDPKNPLPVKYYFAVIRPDGAASPAFTKVMQDPAWIQLKLWGHTVKDFTATDARERLKIDTGTTPLPAVATLVVKDNQSFLARPAIPLPAGDAILKLPELK